MEVEVCFFFEFLLRISRGIRGRVQHEEFEDHQEWLNCVSCGEGEKSVASNHEKHFSKGFVIWPDYPGCGG